MNDEMKHGKIGALVTAAGMSSRMGQFKPLLPLGEKTVAETLVDRLSEAGADRVVIVTGNHADKLEPALQKDFVTFLHNDNYETAEMLDSVKLGLEELNGHCGAVFITPVDVPMFRPETLAEMLETMEITGAQIVLPTCKGRHGHPVLLRADVIPEVLSYSGKGGLKTATVQFDAVDAETDDEGTLLDIDTPQDYDKLLELRKHSAPTAAEILEVYEFFDTPEAVMRHSHMVCAVSRRICSTLQKAGYALDTQLVTSGALLHDAARTNPAHAEECAKKLMRMGYSRLAVIVGTHMDLPAGYQPKIDEASVLYLADKLCCEERIITIKERIDMLTKKYHNSEDALKSALKRLSDAQNIQKLIESKASILDFSD